MKFVSAAACFAALGACAVASAQDINRVDYYPSGLTLKAGAVLPIDNSLRSLGNVLLNVGVEYQINRPLLEGGETYFLLEAFLHTLGSGRRGSAVPFTINHRVYTNENLYRSYYFFGLGVTYMDINRSGTGITVRGGLGTELGPRFVGELAGYLSTGAAGAHNNAISATVGYRF